MNILCATDFSEVASHAARVAGRLAQRFDGSVTLAHCWRLPTIDYMGMATGGAEVAETARQCAGEELDKAAAELRRVGATVKTRLVEGDSAHGLAALAHELSANLIVIGTHGRRGSSRMLLGSVAERMMLLTECPIVVVRRAVEDVEVWAGGSRPLKVVVGLDHSAASRAALAWVGELRRKAPCDVSLVHLYWPGTEYERLGLRGPRDLARSDDEVTTVIRRELRPLIEGLPGDGQTSLLVVPTWGSPADALINEVEKIRADLLVVGTHQRGAMARVWLGSTAHPAVRICPVPVVCVPGAEESAHPVPKIRSVLVATDLSPLGNSAIPFAFALPNSPGATVTICHVHERAIPRPTYAYKDEVGTLHVDDRRTLETRLKALLPPASERLGVRTEVVVVDGGEAAEGINQEANRRGVDVICLASHGRSGLGKVLLASVADTVVRKAERAVTIVRSPRR